MYKLSKWYRYKGLTFFLLYLFQLNPHVNDFQRRYVSEVRRCSEMERKLRWVAGELPEPPPPPKPSPRVLSPREINILEVMLQIFQLQSLFEVNIFEITETVTYGYHRQRDSVLILSCSLRVCC